MDKAMGREERMRDKVLRASMLIVFMTAVTACSTVYSGTGGISSAAEYNPVTGNLTQEFSAPLDKTWEATLASLEALELTVIQRTKDQLGGRVMAKRADGTDVEVNLSPRGLELTVVVIEVGGGDQEASIRISQELERRLKR